MGKIIIKSKIFLDMKNFISAAVLAAIAAATQNQQIEHIWRTSPLWHEESDCANDEPEWECLMRPLLLSSAAAVVKITNEWTADKRKELIDLNIKLEVAKKEHKEAIILLRDARCSHDREVAMRQLYACEIAALRTYTNEATAYPASWTEWLRQQEDCVHKYNAAVALVCFEGEQKPPGAILM